MAGPSDHEPSGAHQSKKAAASGWIGSALEYYDFFIYATAASLVFPQIFFPSENPTVAIVASLATYGVGYVARPIGAFVLGHLGDTHGRKTVLLVCMFIMGFSTMAVGILPTHSLWRGGWRARRSPAPCRAPRRGWRRSAARCRRPTSHPADPSPSRPAHRARLHLICRAYRFTSLELALRREIIRLSAPRST